MALNQKFSKAALGVFIFFLVVAVFYALPVHLPQEPAIPRAETIPSTSILFVGDMFFDRFIRRVTETVGGDYVFSCIYPLLAQADFVVGNLEGPITPHASVTKENATQEPDHFKFTFPPEIAETLFRHNILAVNLGNNHIGNFGLEGLESTKAYLSGADVGYFGGLSGDEPVLQKDSNGVPLSFVSYNQFGGGDPETVAERIAAEASLGRVVIVYTHWGEEYSTSTKALYPTAKLFADSGASAVIGSHPHVVAGHEYIGNTLVYYSLGNFIFDQYWNESVSSGLAVLLHISPNSSEKISVTEHQVILTTDGRVCEKI